MYLLDANTFIEAKNRYYRMRVCPGYWHWLLQAFEKQHIASIKQVQDELLRGRDDLAAWVDAAPQLFLQASDAPTQIHFSAVTNHAARIPNLKPAALPDFLGGADPWLIAKAIHLGATVVTHEVFEPAIRRKVSIPNVCQALGVPFMNTFDLLDRLGAQFVMA